MCTVAFWNVIILFASSKRIVFATSQKGGQMIAKSQLEDKLTTYFGLPLYSPEICSPMLEYWKDKWPCQLKHRGLREKSSKSVKTPQTVKSSMSTMCDIMDWESEISVKHKTKMFPNVKNGVNFCAKPDTHTITVRDYVILNYMENSVHLPILNLRQLILDHLEILCTSWQFYVFDQWHEQSLAHTSLVYFS